jgi:hypothetical protein
MKRQRTSLDISTEVRSNVPSWHGGGYEGDTSSPAAGLRREWLNTLPHSHTTTVQVTSGQGSIDIIVNIAVIKRLGENDVVCRNLYTRPVPA